MAIEKGRDWGEQRPLPEGATVARSDAEIAAAASVGATHVRPSGGDLARTVGVSDQSLTRPAAVSLPVDLIEVRLDEQAPVVASAHVLVGASRRPLFAVMNAAFVARANVAPRAHPGDGRLDVVRFELGPIDWIKAWRRMPTGAHVPHPGISIARTTQWSHTFEAPVRVTIDGQPAGRSRHLTCRVLPDAIIVGV